MKFLILNILFLHSVAGFALCKKWSMPKVIGKLNHKIINESSGLAISEQFDNRMYHINDSGDGPFFYITDAIGNNTQKVMIDNFKPRDVEDLAIGKCPQGQCLVIGDIGDNKKKRKEIRLIIVKEEKKFSKSIKPISKLKLKYPDYPQDAESIAIHPETQDLYLISKNPNFETRKVAPSNIYRVSAKDWQTPKSKNLLLEKVGSIDFSFLNYYYNFFGRQPTSMDFSLDGKSFAVLTYGTALVFDMDLSKRKIPESKKLLFHQDYQFIEIKDLPQEEAISFTRDGKGVIYTTEFKGSEAPIIRMDCISGQI